MANHFLKLDDDISRLIGNLRFIDDEKVYFGTGDDAEIYYDGTDLVINPKAVGSGILAIGGAFTSEYNSYIGDSATNSWLVEKVTVAGFGSNLPCLTARSSDEPIGTDIGLISNYLAIYDTANAGTSTLAFVANGGTVYDVMQMDVSGNITLIPETSDGRYFLSSGMPFYSLGLVGYPNKMIAGGTGGTTESSLNLEYKWLGDGDVNDGIRLAFMQRNDSGFFGTAYMANYITSVQTSRTVGAEESYLTIGGFTGGASAEWLRMTGVRADFQGLEILTTGTGIFGQVQSTTATASGVESIAFGDRATASGECSAAFGDLATASGQHSFAAGERAEATGSGCIAIGERTYSYGTDSFALGSSSSSAGVDSFAMGYQSIADAFNNTFAIGYGAYAGADNAFALGHGSYSEAEYGLMLGGGKILAAGAGSTCIGLGSSGTGDFSAANTFGVDGGNVEFFNSSTDIGDAVDGHSFYIYRKAAEGDNYIQMYIDAVQEAHILSDAPITINCPISITTQIGGVDQSVLSLNTMDFKDNAIVTSGTLNAGAITTTGPLNVSGDSGIEFTTLASKWAFKYADGLGIDNTGVYFNVAGSYEIQVTGVPVFTVSTVGGGICIGNGASDIVVISCSGLTNDGYITWEGDAADDYWKFSDDIFMSTDHEIFFRDQNKYINASDASNLNIACDGTINLFPTSQVILGSGSAGVDYSLLFNGETNNGLITWMEDEDYFDIADTVKTSGGRIHNTDRYTANQTLTQANHEVFCDTDVGAFTITLPASPPDGLTYRIINCDSSGNNLTIGRNGETILGDASDYVLGDGEVIVLTFETTEGWW